MSEKLLTARQVMERLACRSSTFYKRIRPRQDFPQPTSELGRPLWREADINRFIESLFQLRRPA